MLKVETERLDKEAFIQEFNAGKHVGFFELPSMITRKVLMNPHARGVMEQDGLGA